jgi:hypothetical protein
MRALTVAHNPQLLALASALIAAGCGGFGESKDDGELAWTFLDEKNPQVIDSLGDYRLRRILLHSMMVEPGSLTPAYEG